jgi:hypothetical protein
MFNLNQKREFLESVCGNTFAVLHSVENCVSRIIKVRMYCRSWLCPRCRRKRAKGFANAALSYFKGDRCRMFSVTVDRSDNLRTAYTTFAARWNRFRIALERKIGKFRYIRVLEAQPGSGYPHYHVIIDRYVDQKLLSSVLVHAGFGSHAYIQDISAEDAFYYVLKYLRKDCPNEEALKIISEFHIRRCSGSAGFACVGSGSGEYHLLGIYKSSEFCNLLIARLYKSAINSHFSCQSFQSFEDFDSITLSPPSNLDPFFCSVELDVLTKQYELDVVEADWFVSPWDITRDV